ncbi:hypothetical protein OFY05_03780 [Pseudocitrobacter faecalis]|nr:hypothetical protein OFY05_03780 [Pseudocitrobacter faecalis]
MTSLPSSLTTSMTQRLELSDAQFRRISQLIHQRAGIVLADHKRDMVYNRLVRRLRTLGLDDFGHYLSLLEGNTESTEWQAFINSLTTNLTAFFREAHHFPTLAEHAAKRRGEYRVWSAAAFYRRGTLFHRYDARPDARQRARAMEGVCQ